MVLKFLILVTRPRPRPLFHRHFQILPYSGN